MYPLVEFLVELRYRACYLVLGFAFNFLLFYCYSTELLFLFSKPLVNLTNIDKFIYTSLSDALFVYLKLAFYATSASTLFLLWYHVVTFLSAGLFNYELTRFLNLSLLAFFVFACGLLFFYLIFIPVVLWFFYINSFSALDTIRLAFEARVTDYLELVFEFLFLYIFIVQAPVLVSFYAYCRFLTYSIYKRHRVRFLLGCLSYVLIFSPPDIFTQAILFVYIFGTSELLVFLENLTAGYKIRNLK